MNKKVLFVFGTRPEAIKMAPLIGLFRNDRSFITGVCVTAQHREMLDMVLKVFGIIPDWDLDIMKDNQDLFDLSASVLLKIKKVLVSFDPDLVLVHGDTTTSMASALASFYLHIPVGHVEAGLRTNDIYSPWPEEINRQILSRISSFNFAPTESSKDNLLREGISEDKILVTGNTIVDALHHALNIINENPPQIPGLSDLKIIPGKERNVVLITGHRRENFGDGFESICRAIVRLAQNYPHVHFIYPLHLNPNIRDTVKKLLNPEKIKNIHLIGHLSYLPFVALMNRADIILTDSGGVQEEAPCLGKPVLVMRKITERPEGIDSGVVRIVGTEENNIITEVSKLLSDDSYYHSVAKKVSPYGDGKASMRIYRFIKDHFLVS